MVLNHFIATVVIKTIIIIKTLVTKRNSKKKLEGNTNAKNVGKVGPIMKNSRLNTFTCCDSKTNVPSLIYCNNIEAINYFVNVKEHYHCFASINSFVPENDETLSMYAVQRNRIHMVKMILFECDLENFRAQIKANNKWQNSNSKLINHSTNALERANIKFQEATNVSECTGDN